MGLYGKGAFRIGRPNAGQVILALFGLVCWAVALAILVGRLGWLPTAIIWANIMSGHIALKWSRITETHDGRVE